MGEVTHDFNASLEKDRVDDFDWEGVYRQAFENVVEVVSTWDSKKHQEQGIDRIVRFANGAELTVDEKIREQAWDDMLIEYISREEDHAPGWIAAPGYRPDLIAYAWRPTRKVLIVPYALLKLAWKRNAKRWEEEKCKIVRARNFRRYDASKVYHTISMAVPVAKIESAIRNLIRSDEREGGVIPNHYKERIAAFL